MVGADGNDMAAALSARGFGASVRERKGQSDTTSRLVRHRATYNQHVAPWRSLGRLENAEPILNLLAQSQTEHAEVYRDLEALARSRGDDRAADRYRDLWLQHPSDHEAELSDQASTALELGRSDRAVQLYRTLLQRAPGQPQASLALAHLLLRQEALAEGRQVLRNAVVEAGTPAHREVTALLAFCTVELGESAEAIRLARLTHNHGQDALSHALLAAALQQQAREHEALKHLQHARDLCSDPCQAPWPIPRLLSRICLEQNRLACAEPLLQAACLQQPTSRTLQYQLGELLLLQGQLTIGFRQWAQARQQRAGEGALAGCALPLYREAVDPGPLHLVADGTLGDTLLFSRYAPWIAAQLDQAVHYYVHPPAVNLLRDSLPLGIMVKPLAQLPRHGTGQVLPLLMAPAVFGACDQQPSLRAPCLQANPQLVEAWRQKLNLAEGERLIGINWHGSALQAVRERVRSDIPLEAFAGLASQPGVRLVSLQKGIGTEQLKACRFLHRFVGCQEEVSREHRLEQMAALMSLCEWIVCDDSGPAHLAGSLGRPTLLLLCERTGWRWGAHGDSSPWYPSLQMLRCTQQTGWTGLVDQAITRINQAP